MRKEVEERSKEGITGIELKRNEEEASRKEVNKEEKARKNVRKKY